MWEQENIIFPLNLENLYVDKRWKGVYANVMCLQYSNKIPSV